MFDTSLIDSAAVRATVVTALIDAANRLRSGDVDDAGRIDRLACIRRAEAALAAADAVESVEFLHSQLEEQERLGVPARRRGRGIADQIGLATRRSPATSSRRLAQAGALVSEMPEVLTALADGRISPLGASIAVRETACLTRDDRHRVSRELAVAGGLSERELEVATRRRVQELDLEAAVRRAAKAREDRYVSIRPEPDAMARLSAVLPVEQCVAVYASLRKAAESAHATGDERTKTQLMADTLVERATGQAVARMVPVEIAVVMTSDALLGRTDEPAHLPGYGPIPARVVRQLATDGVVETVTDDPSAPDVDIPATEAEKARVWIRRMLTDPVDGTVTDVDSRRRRFNRSAATFIRLRDQVCRDPHCDAPIRDLDHLHDYADGGRTTIDNGIGLCQRGNLVDQVPGWHIAGTSRQRIIVTPTGHRYESRPPPALGSRLPVVDRAVELPRAG